MKVEWEVEPGGLERVGGDLGERVSITTMYCMLLYPDCRPPQTIRSPTRMQKQRVFIYLSSCSDLSNLANVVGGCGRC